MERDFAETYTLRSTFFRLLGEAGKLLADAYTQADLENQATIRELAFEAMSRSLIEHHGYTREDIVPPSAGGNG